MNFHSKFPVMSHCAYTKNNKNRLIRFFCNFLQSSDTQDEDAAERQDQLSLVTFRRGPEDWFKNNYSKAPSSAADTSQSKKRQERSNEMIFCGRPYSVFEAVPPTLLCPQFSQFVIDLDSCTPSTLDIEHFHELCTQMSDIFIRELPRKYQIH